jgi:hypothetical protein
LRKRFDAGYLAHFDEISVSPLYIALAVVLSWELSYGQPPGCLGVVAWRMSLLSPQAVSGAAAG